MSVLSATEVITLLFEARARGDVRRLKVLLDPDLEIETPTRGEVLHGAAAVRWIAAREAPGEHRVEADAHRIEPQRDGSVHVHGRVRVIGGGSIADSPAAWRFVVRRGRVASIMPLVAEARLRKAA